MFKLWFLKNRFYAVGFALVVQTIFMINFFSVVGGRYFIVAIIVYFVSKYFMNLLFCCRKE